MRECKEVDEEPPGLLFPSMKLISAIDLPTSCTHLSACSTDMVSSMDFTEQSTMKTNSFQLQVLTQCNNKAVAMHLQQTCSWGRYGLLLLCDVSTVQRGALKQQTYSKRKRREETWPNTRLQSTEWKYFTRADIQLNNHFLHYAVLNKQNLKDVEKQRLLQENTCAAVKLQLRQAAGGFVQSDRSSAKHSAISPAPRLAPPTIVYTVQVVFESFLTRFTRPSCSQDSLTVKIHRPSNSEQNQVIPDCRLSTEQLVCKEDTTCKYQPIYTTP